MTTMEVRKLGRTGLKVSALCMGTMQFGWSCDETQSFEVLNATFEAGINFLDTADVYSRWVEGNPGGVAEQIIGNWIKKYNIPRDQLVIATKVRGRMWDGPNGEGLSRTHILAAVEASLRRLQTDYIDLYQTHWPDGDTPIEETLQTLDDLVRQGKVRYVGASNYNAWQLMQALWASDKRAGARYDSLQPHYNLIERAEFERELQVVCQTYRIGVIPYSPLAGGFLTGKYRRGQIPDSKRAAGLKHLFTESSWALLDKMEQIAKAHGNYTIAQVALAWLLANPVITSPIIGATSVAQLHDNLGALELKLTAEECQQLSELTRWEPKEE